ncbi:MAG TPA: ATP phosphoribosyltransferase regulatory subunit, partial [Thermoanaerobaculia bacterium]|nr:ATP phosphoribosyltransferase regulatory subunit [Thermoanaerobaculia bacterium]
VMLFGCRGRLGFTGLSVSLNSVGTEEERPGFIQALRAWFSSKVDLLDADDRRRLEENPLRVLDSKNPKLAEWLADPSLPRMVDHLSQQSSEHHAELLRFLDAARIPYRIEPRLVRGLDYYTRTVFEVTAAGLGAQNALLGGGRYDKLVSDLGGPKTPGIGFAIGEDRLVDVLPSEFRQAAVAAVRGVTLVPLDRGDLGDALALAGELRRAGIAVDLVTAAKGPGPGLKVAERTSAAFALLLGEKERAAGTVVLKVLATRSQEELPRGSVVETLRARL